MRSDSKEALTGGSAATFAASRSSRGVTSDPASLGREPTVELHVGVRSVPASIPQAALSSVASSNGDAGGRPYVGPYVGGRGETVRDGSETGANGQGAAVRTEAGATSSS